VGTPSEQPAIRELTSGKSIGEPYVEVARNPSNPLIPVLIITGSKSEDVLTAARAMAKNERNFLNGNSASVALGSGKVSEGRVSVSHDWRPNYLPDRDDFTLKEMGRWNK